MRADRRTRILRRRILTGLALLVLVVWHPYPHAATPEADHANLQREVTYWAGPVGDWPAYTARIQEVCESVPDRLDAEVGSAVTAYGPAAVHTGMRLACPSLGWRVPPPVAPYGTAAWR